MRIKHLAFFFIGAALLTSCDEKTSTNGSGTEEEATNTVDPKIIEESNPHTANGDAAIQEIAEITWDKTRHNFGKVHYQQKVLYNFQFENTGDKDLVIVDARASCGCTTPEWPKEPIPPGGRGFVKVGFKSTSTGPFNKQITVDANTQPKSTVLYISGEVLEQNN